MTVHSTVHLTECAEFSALSALSPEPKMVALGGTRTGPLRGSFSWIKLSVLALLEVSIFASNANRLIFSAVRLHWRVFIPGALVLHFFSRKPVR